MSGWKLPTSVTVCGQEFAIRSDYRAVLDAISALRDPELSPQEQTLACLEILYPDWKLLPDLSAAAQAAMVFINCGKPVEAAGANLCGLGQGPVRSRRLVPDCP